MSRWPGAAVFRQGATLETGRLRLRVPEERDLEAFAAIYADAETMRFIGEGRTFNRAETWRSIANMLGHWLLRGYGMWTVERKDTGAAIGRVGYLDSEGWPGFELGWLLARPEWGRGYATEAARAALDHATGALGRERVISLIRPGNAPSARVAAKLGLRREGEIELLGGPVDVYANRPAP